MHRITLIPGDGIGPEVTESAKRCIEATGLDVKWEEVHAGTGVLEKEGTPLPEKVIESIKKNKIALKGPIITPVGEGFRSVNVALRQRLNLYACLRPCKSFIGSQAPYKNVDIVIIRENTEDLYAGIEFEEGQKETRKLIEEIEKLSSSKIKEDSAISIKLNSISATRRIVKFAFEYALNNNRKEVTAVHKANILKYSDGLFLKTAREVAKNYEGRVGFTDRIVDNICMQLVLRPKDFDVLVLPNLYGDIISDLCAGLVGGLGLAPGANIGDKCAVFEATHGAAPKYQGKNKVNPTAMILSGVLMLKYLNENEKAEKIEKAVAKVIQEGKRVTYDLKETREDPTAVGTTEMTNAIIEEIKGKG
jgi:isocitrate dehydrogenase (NAD+)